MRETSTPASAGVTGSLAQGCGSSRAYLIAIGLTGVPTPPVNGSAGAISMNS